MPTVTSLAKKYVQKFKTEKYIEGAEKLTRIVVDTVTGIPVLEFIPEVTQSGPTTGFVRSSPEEEKEFSLAIVSLIIEPQRTLLIDAAKELVASVETEEQAEAVAEAQEAIETFNEIAEPIVEVVETLAKPALIFIPKILPKANPNAPSTRQ